MRYVLVHHHELLLKRGNRGYFVGRLIRNLQHGLKGTGLQSVEQQGARLVLAFNEHTSEEEIRGRLARTFGVANFSFAQRLPLDWALLAQAVTAAVSGRSFHSFRISTKRLNKAASRTSNQINIELGSLVQALTGSRVNLEHPELTIHVEVLDREILLYLDRTAGPGGLPSGVSGRVVCLMSGGLDSPVAAYRMMKRGAYVVFVHFHSHPLVSRASQEKARELVESLTRFQYTSRLFLVPFGEVQRAIVLAVAAPLRVLLYRRMMVRIAETIARSVRARALVTGEALGQVASQTLANMVAVDAVASMPILRPLVGMDKEEIVHQAQALGTYEISIQPDEDCCSLFTPKHPATRSTSQILAAEEAKLDLPGLIRMAVEHSEELRYAYPPQTARV